MKKISLPEAVFVLLVCATSDIIEFFTTIFGFGIGELIDFFLNLALWPLLQFYLTIKGARGGWFLAGSLIEFIPFLNALPTRTIAMLITIIKTNRSK